MIFELKTNPLGFQAIVPLGDGQHALRAFAPLTTAGAQALILALLAQPEVGGELASDLKDNLQAALVEHDQVQSADQEFLRGVGAFYD
jgi:hypothetical protein